MTTPLTPVVTRNQLLLALPPAVLGQEDLGPLPLELRARAQYLLGRCRRLESELVAAGQAVSLALAALDERPAPGPAYFDMSL